MPKGCICIYSFYWFIDYQYGGHPIPKDCDGMLTTSIVIEDEYLILDNYYKLYIQLFHSHLRRPLLTLVNLVLVPRWTFETCFPLQKKNAQAALV